MSVYSKIKHANHLNPSVTTGNYAKTKCFPFVSVQFSTNQSDLRLLKL